jgi:hypothetical protein
VVVYVAPDPFLSRFAGSTRLAYGIPDGNLFKGQSLSGLESAMYRIEGDSDFLVVPQLIIGVHAAFALGGEGNSISGGCSADGVSCTIWNFDIGAHAEYMFLPREAPFSPWVGAGVGWELLSYSTSDSAGNSASGSASGFDFDVSGGLDFNAGRLQFGPYVNIKAGQYTTVSDAFGDSTSVTNTDWHEWIIIGIRGRLWGR